MPQLYPSLQDMVAHYVHTDVLDDEYRDAAAVFLEKRLNGSPRKFHGMRLSKPSLGYRPCASAWIVNPATGRVLLMRHRHTGELWPPGGEFEDKDEASPIACARREIRKETGMPGAIARRLAPWMNPLADIHLVPSLVKKKPGTWMIFTVGFWFPPDAPHYWNRVKTQSPVEWHALPDLLNKTEDPSLKRLIRKTQMVLNEGFKSADPDFK